MALTKIGDAGMPAGAVLQVVQSVKTGVQSITASSFTDITDLSVIITPSSTSSKILVMHQINWSVVGTNNVTYSMRLLRDSTVINGGDVVSSSQSGIMMHNNVTASDDAQYSQRNNAGSYLDSPNTTSAITYKAQGMVTFNSGSLTINRNHYGLSSTRETRAASTITVMEIAG